MDNIKISSVVYSGADCGVVRLQVFPAQVQEEEKRNLLHSNHRALTEEQLDEEFGNAYDQPKVCSAEDDDDDAHVPYRYLKGWYLFNPSEPMERLPLPDKSLYFPKMTVLRGWLQPPEGQAASGEMKPVLIELNNLSYYSMDRSPEYRGYWIQSQRTGSGTTHPPFYWLQEPERLTRNTLLCTSSNHMMAQQEVHFSARAVLAIVTALCDFVFGDHQILSNVNQSVEQVLRAQPLLHTNTVSPDDLYVFELRLLAKYRHGVAMHLAGYVPEQLQPDRSLFLQSLLQLPPENNPITEREIEHWCEAMERQCHQNWWGGPRKNNAVDRNAVPATTTTALPNSLTMDTDDREKVVVDRLPTTPFPENSGSALDIVLLKVENILELTKPSTVDTWTKDNLVPSTKRKPKDSTDTAPNKRPRGNSATVGEDKSDSHAINVGGLSEMALKENFEVPRTCVDYFRLAKDGNRTNVFVVSDDKDKGREFFVNLAAFDAKKGPLIWAVVALESLGRSFAAQNPRRGYIRILKGLFRTKRRDGRWLAQIVFHDMCDQCLSILQQKGSKKEDQEVALSFLKALVSLISSCALIIKHKKHFDKILERGIDWEHTTAEVRRFVLKTNDLNDVEREGLLIRLDRADRMIQVIKMTEKDRGEREKDTPSTVYYVGK